MSEEFGKLRKRAAERWGSCVVDGDELNRLLARLDTSESELSRLRARLAEAERLLRGMWEWQAKVEELVPDKLSYDIGRFLAESPGIHD